MSAKSFADKLKRDQIDSCPKCGTTWIANIANCPVCQDRIRTLEAQLRIAREAIEKSCKCYPHSTQCGSCQLLAAIDADAEGEKK